ncbi:hypothetical protein HYX00_06505 [Candidatus Woesearchaeota archaeon]|nr:hypothetical protein [Candidatus Woesearchaeota archaeon]
MHIFSNILGVFVFDDKFKVVDEILFKNLEDNQKKDAIIQQIQNKYKNLKEMDEEALKKILIYFKSKKFFGDFQNKNLELTKSDLKNSVSADILLIHAVNSVNELDKAINILVKRLREWYELYNPEFSISIANHEEFVKEILEKEKSELLRELKIDADDSIGADLKQEDLEPIRSLTHQIYNLYELRENHMEYISTLMEELCPNTKAICGAYIGAKLIEHAGSLKRLSEMPASTIQILGAEKALFRHMKTGAKPPRHGIIVNHPLIAKAPNSMHGKIARALADKIAIAAKIDYFQGHFIGDKLRKDLEEKFGK